jgi:dephospho-CoA kinase
LRPGNDSSTKPVIGLIGGIGSGKSRAAAAFVRHGAYLVSGDKAGHEALRQPDIRSRIVQRWGAQVLDDDGEINRRRLGALVFAEAAQLRKLEALVFPFIERRLREEIELARRDPKVRFILLDAAVLLEAGWMPMCDRIVYVHAPREVRLRRLAGQRGWSPEEVSAREQVQLPLTDKVTRADHALDNSGSLESLDRQVADLVAGWGLDPAVGTPETLSVERTDV